ncbi:Uncharacterised protein [Vibrio cholerae]|nr:Uncharacterised protein [Vibrio cholerae]
MRDLVSQQRPVAGIGRGIIASEFGLPHLWRDALFRAPRDQRCAELSAFD